MIAIAPLHHFDPTRFREIATGYTTDRVYRVSKVEDDALTRFELALERLPEPAEFRFPFGPEEFDRYTTLVQGDTCFGAFDGDELVGVLLAEPHWWNRTLWVWDFHVAQTHQRRGAGSGLMAAAADKARELALRAVVAETQNTNVPAIGFYRRAGFVIDGVDLSYYTNDDALPGGSVAVFMKLKLV